MQIAKYILWSLLLAAFHVCTNAIIGKLSTLPDTSKPGHLLQLIFVHCQRRVIWLRLLNRCCDWFCQRGEARYPPANRAAAAPTITQQVPLELRSEVPNDVVKNESVCETVVPEKVFEKSEGLSSWKSVSEGLNRWFIVAYLLCNALVFALYLFPLLCRIFVQSSLSSYVLDID